MKKTAIVTCADEKYFDILCGLILSIRDKPEGIDASIVVFDIGLSAPSLDWLRVRGVTVNKFVFPASSIDIRKIPLHIQAFLARSRIPDLIPGYEVYLWLDADAWVQDWAAVNRFFSSALAYGFAVVAEDDPCYPVKHVASSHQKTFGYFSNVLDEPSLAVRAVNAGCFAGRADSPIWQLWTELMQRCFNTNLSIADLFLFDQTALSVCVGKSGDRVKFLESIDNYICHYAPPILDTDNKTFLRPAVPHNRLGVVHMTSHTKREWLRLNCIGGGVVTKSLRYSSQSTLPVGDYVSPNMAVLVPDQFFPNMTMPDRATCGWKFLRRDVKHNWYADKRLPSWGFLSRDEAHILYNMALRFKGRRALEIGCLWGWSAFHLAAAGVDLDIIDPLLKREEVRESVRSSLQSAKPLKASLFADYSPDAVRKLAERGAAPWSLFFIDGDHEGDAPLKDAMVCEEFAASDAVMIFHDVVSPHVAAGVRYLYERGWQIKLYHTMQIMAVAWRGQVKPVAHLPDPRIRWEIPDHLGDLL